MVHRSLRTQGGPAARTSGPSPEDGSAHPRPASAGIVDGSGPHVSEVLNDLLQARLRAVALFLTVVLALTLVRDLLLGSVVAWQLQVAATLAIAAAVALLSAPRPFSRRSLEGVQVVVFGLAASVLALRQYHALLRWGSLDDEVSVMAAAKNMIMAATTLMFAYAMLIPNTFRESWKYLLAFAVFPAGTQALLLIRHPELFPVFRQLATVERISRDVGQMLIAAGLSVYGAHIVNSFRKEAFEARQLNQYRLGEKIGSGGMGDVFRAEHQLLKRPCAVKLIRPEQAGNPRVLARFEREVRATARLSHPNTVEIYDFGHADDGSFFYVMELLHGRTLEELVALHGPLPPGRVIYLLRQACEALAEAHGAGLIHRDLKPANLFAARRGGRFDFVKLLDFGLVEDTADREERAADRPRALLGTPQYMAPEQVARDRPIDHRCDLYAVGGVAYTLLTGRAPFEGDTAEALMRMQIHDTVVPPSRLRPEVPDDLERIVLRCLEKDPAQRYSSADALEQALGICATAHDWNARKAAEWWRAHGPRDVTTGP